MRQLEIKLFEVADWPTKAATLITEKIARVLNANGNCSVMLTGGHNAARLYKAWSILPAFHLLSGVSFYFGDERCVPPDHSESNYGMAMRTLFQYGVPVGCSVFCMDANAINKDEEAQRYDNLLPHSIDVLLLGVGSDGHIASLFPNSDGLQERQRGVIPITGSFEPFERMTITPQVLKKVQSCFVLASGAMKVTILSEALSNPNDIASMPVRLVLDSTWLMDSH